MVKKFLVDPESQTLVPRRKLVVQKKKSRKASLVIAGGMCLLLVSAVCGFVAVKQQKNSVSGQAVVEKENFEATTKSEKNTPSDLRLTSRAAKEDTQNADANGMTEFEGQSGNQASNEHLEATKTAEKASPLTEQETNKDDKVNTDENTGGNSTPDEEVKNEELLNNQAESRDATSKASNEDKNMQRGTSEEGLPEENEESKFQSMEVQEPAEEAADDSVENLSKSSYPIEEELKPMNEEVDQSNDDLNERLEPMDEVSDEPMEVEGFQTSLPDTEVEGEENPTELSIEGNAGDQMETPEYFEQDNANADYGL